MEKRTLLANIERALRDGTITKADLNRLVGKPHKDAPASARSSSVSISDVLYGIGAFIVLIGIVIVVGDNWESLSSVVRILITFGMGIASYVAALLLLRDGRTGNLANAFILLSVLLLPVGLYVTFQEAGYDTGSNYVHSLVSFILAATYFSSYALLRRSIFLAFGIVFATWFYFAFLSLIIGETPLFERWRFHAYQALVMGASYLALGYAFDSIKPRFAGPMYAVGSLVFLGSALSLGGYFPDNSLFWEFSYSLYVFGAIFLSVYLHRRSLLIAGSLFLMIYILKITGEYFSESLSWGTAVIVVGFLLIAIGYFTYDINKKYLSKKK